MIQLFYDLSQDPQNATAVWNFLQALITHLEKHADKVMNVLGKEKNVVVALKKRSEGEWGALAAVKAMIVNAQDPWYVQNVMLSLEEGTSITYSFANLLHTLKEQSSGVYDEINKKFLKEAQKYFEKESFMEKSVDVPGVKGGVRMKWIIVVLVILLVIIVLAGVWFMRDRSSGPPQVGFED